MTELKATPGPWHVGGAHGAIVYAGDGYAVASCATYHGRFSNEEAEKNSLLIAAAPDMLHALNMALEYWQDRQQRYKNRSPVWVQEARAAIAKATEVKS